MNRTIIYWLAGILAVISLPATAQHLSSGDYALCEVRDRDARFIGYDSVCLASRRVALRQLTRFEPAPSIYYCPIYANSSYGYTGTTTFHGGPVTHFGTFDSTVNGNPCFPRPVTIQRGWR